MTLKHRANFINPALKEIKDPATVQAFQELMEQLSDLWPNVYDDLKNDGLIQKDFNKNIFKILQGFGLKRLAITHTASPYAALNSDCIISCDVSGGSIEIDLPAAATAEAGRIYVIKDEGGDAATNNITIDPNGAETIDGANPEVITTNYGIRILYCTGTGWAVVAAGEMAAGAAVTNATGAGDVVAQLNALLASLRTANIIET